MSRIYVCPVVLETNRVDDDGQPLSDLQYAYISRLPGVTRCRAAISVDTTGGARGRARFDWCICYVDADNWADVEGDGQCFHITGEVLDAPMRNQIRNQIRNRGYLTSEEADSLGTNRDAVLLMLRKHYPDATDESISRQFGGLV